MLCLTFFSENNSKIFIAIIISIILIISCTIYAKVRKNKILKTKQAKVTNINIYKRELPNDLTPAHVRVLIEDGSIDSYTLAATILDLVDRGYLSTESKNKNDIFNKDIYLSVTDKSQEDLFTYEKYLIEWFFDTPKISSKDLKRKLNNNNENPSEKFNIFQGLVLLSFPLEKYYKKIQENRNEKMYIFFILSIFITPFLFKGANSLILFTICAFLPIYAFSMKVFAPLKYVLTDKGVNIKDEYLDFKKYLTDFSLIPEKKVEMIYLWNYYLSYSIALGIDGVAKDEIVDFFGNNIYNSHDLNNNECQKYIQNIDKEIIKSKKLYQNKNI